MLMFLSVQSLFKKRKILIYSAGWHAIRSMRIAGLNNHNAEKLMALQNQARAYFSIIHPGMQYGHSRLTGPG